MGIYKYPLLDNILDGEDIDVRVKDRTPETAHPPQGSPHTHDFIVLSYMKSGECVQVVDGVEYLTKRGDLLFIGKNQTHQIKLSGHCVYVNILLSSRFWSEELKNVDNFQSIFALSIFNEFKGRYDKVSPVISFSGVEIPEIEGIIERMLREFEAREIGYRAILKCYTQIIITMLLRKFSSANRYAAFMLGEAMKKIVDYIDVNLGGRLSLHELAEQCSYNPSYFSRIFKECFDMPFTEYVQQRRIHTAMELLREPSLTIEAIMSQIGYSDKKSFYRYFKKITGQTPAQYRKSLPEEKIDDYHSIGGCI